jgi:hypothetical protein
VKVYVVGTLYKCEIEIHKRGMSIKKGVTAIIKMER